MSAAIQTFCQVNLMTRLHSMVAAPFRSRVMLRRGGISGTHLVVAQALPTPVRPSGRTTVRYAAANLLLTWTFPILTFPTGFTGTLRVMATFHPRKGLSLVAP